MHEADSTGGFFREQTRRDLGLGARRALRTAAAAGLVLASASAARAAGTWSASAATSDWGTPTNWNSSTIAGTTTKVASVNDTANFNASSQLSVLPDTDRTIGTILFGSTAGSYTIGAPAGNTLYLAGNGSGGITAGSSVANTTITFGGPLALLTTYQFLSASSSSANTLVLAGGITSAATSGTTDLQLKGANTGANTVTGVIGNGGSGAAVSLTKLNSGSWIVSSNNTFTGKTTIGQGTLSVASLNYVTSGTWAGHLTGSNLGMPGTTTAGTIGLGSDQAVSPFTPYTGQLTYTGAGETTDRVINLAGKLGGGVIDQSGTGLLKFTSNFTATGVGSKSLTLQGSTSAAGEIAGYIRDNSTASGYRTSLIKSGSGTWTLSGANIYTGGTQVNDGTLRLGTGTTLQNATGDVLVGGGRLLSSTASAFLGGGLTISSGSLSANDTGVGDLTLAAGKSFGMSGGTFALTIASASSFDRIIGSGAGTFSITGGTLDLSGSTIDYSQSYLVLSGFSSGSVSSLSITGYDTAGHTASLASDGTLSFVTVPEPASLGLAMGVVSMGWLGRRRRTA